MSQLRCGARRVEAVDVLVREAEARPQQGGGVEDGLGNVEEAPVSYDGRGAYPFTGDAVVSGKALAYSVLSEAAYL